MGSGRGAAGSVDVAHMEDIQGAQAGAVVQVDGGQHLK